ncbi:MAG: HD domain-containing protein [Armatimonadetes bacterium]|nr:HD domain-containing protein [Armatimonadota bacterium]
MSDESLPPDLQQMAADLNQAQQHFQQARTEWERQAAQLAEARDRLADMEERNRSLTLALETSRGQMAAERQRAQAHQERGDRLAHILQQLHRAVARGNVHQWILQACLSITQASRGLYLTADGPQGALRVRAAVEMDGYPDAAPSERILALCHPVLETGETSVFRHPTDLAGLPGPWRPSEEFPNCVAAPVVLMKKARGVILVAQKRDGTFDDDDVQTLLHIGDEAAAALENETLRRQLQDAYLATVRVLSDAMEVKDPYTQGHSDMVSRYADRIALHLGLSEYDRSIVSYAALLHDIGKIGVSDGVLNKPGPLLPEERALVRSHVRVGADLLRHVPVLDPVAEVVLHHHEWYDGSGYPDGLQGEDIPIGARIVSVVDAYSAMITRRSYKEPYPETRAREELRACARIQFDPRVVEAFLAVLDEPEDEEGEGGTGHDDRLRPLEALFQRHA